MVAQTLQAKKWFIIRSLKEGTFKILSGSYKLFNKPFQNQSTINLNSGDSLLLFAENDINCECSENVVLESTLNNPIPNDWLTLKIDIQAVVKNRIMLIGSNDSGKTTLTKFLAYNLPKKGDTIGIIDLDVGQNSLGLPGTINLSNFSVSETKLTHTKFFGHISPAGNRDLFLHTIRHFFNEIQSFNYNWLIFDTSGYLHTSEAIYIKNGLLSICKPQYVLLLGSGAFELDKKLSTRNIRYVWISSALEGIKKEKTIEMRRNKRKERFIQYFKDSKSVAINIMYIVSIQVNENNETIVLHTYEEIKTFIELNVKKLINLFIGIELENKKTLFYAKIIDVEPDALMCLIPNEKVLPERCSLILGSIHLDQV